MNKQQLAQKIWASANQMRSKIEASEYKDFILGFIFYKYLSDKEIEFLKDNDYDDELLKTVTEDDPETVKWVQENIGYFISYKDFFSTWLGMGKDFDVSNVRDALSAFSRLISPTHKRVFEKIFNTLETGLSKLGDSSGTQTKAISGLLNLIKDIPMDGKQGYDVLGFIYEYLISMSDDEVFHFNINDIVEKGIVSTLYPVFTTDENLDSRYLQYQLNYGHEFAKFAILQKQGGSRTYMYLNKLRQLHLTMPNHVEEQKAISSFFMNLDHLITLHQRELEKLQNIKKSMLEKMFV